MDQSSNQYCINENLSFDCIILNYNGDLYGNIYGVSLHSKHISFQKVFKWMNPITHSYRFNIYISPSGQLDSSQYDKELLG